MINPTADIQDLRCNLMAPEPYNRKLNPDYDRANDYHYYFYGSVIAVTISIIIRWLDTKRFMRDFPKP